MKFKKQPYKGPFLSKDEILLVTEDDNLLNWIVRNFHDRVYRIRDADKISLNKRKPSYLIIGCNYKCSAEQCATRFLLALAMSDVRVAIARPMLLEHPRLSLNEYFLDRISFKTLFQHSMSAETDWLPLLSTDALLLKLRLGHLNCFLPALSAQKTVIQAGGRIRRLNQLEDKADLSIRMLPRQFKRLTGVSLKTFMDRIRICHCFLDLICTRGSIKAISLAYGYRPASFSLKYHAALKTWPTEMRFKADISLLRDNKRWAKSIIYDNK